MTRPTVFVLAAVCALVPASVTSAQTPTITTAGRVVLPRAADTVSLPGARVLLHRIARTAQGVIDSAVSREGGRFRFRFRADTSALYLVSARYGGIEYFSPPVHTNPRRPDTAIRILAYDTSSSAPVSVEARHIVVPRAGSEGTRAVLDLIVLRNDGRLTRVAPDSSRPSWAMALPPGTGRMEVGESDLSPDAVLRVGDSVKVVAPLAPGQKQLSLEYAVRPPRGRLAFRMGAGARSVNLLVEERDARVTGGALALVDSQAIEGRSFLRWTGTVSAGQTIAVTFAGGARLAAWQILVALVVPVAAALAFAAWRVVRRRPAAAVSARSREQLLDAMAVLDARYAGHESTTPVDEWQRYETERAGLKAKVETALAADGASRYV
ncbi:MAG: hypothetical protein H0T86_06370 [Gemmatimonadales bacterium]|nr:hypothetical protein [Gemmatimonadales bacterium]